MVIWLFNILRVLFYVALLAWSPFVSTFVHVFVLQTLTILLICGLFAFWIHLQRRSRRTL